MVTKIKRFYKENDIMNKKEACAYLKIGNTAMNQFINEGGIPFRRVGRCYLFSKEAVDKWLSTIEKN